jgi:hypothetical protein
MFITKRITVRSLDWTGIWAEECQPVLEGFERMQSLISAWFLCPIIPSWEPQEDRFLMVNYWQEENLASENAGEE